MEVELGDKISIGVIKRVLKLNNCLKFKKTKRIPQHANSLRNQYMRQQFSIKMLKLMQEGKRLLAVDETWYGETNYTRQTWQ